MIPEKLIGMNTVTISAKEYRDLIIKAEAAEAKLNYVIERDFYNEKRRKVDEELDGERMANENRSLKAKCRRYESNWFVRLFLMKK